MYTLYQLILALSIEVVVMSVITATITILVQVF
jgi:hypothetical protein